MVEENMAGCSDPIKLISNNYDRDSISKLFCRMFGVHAVVKEYERIYNIISANSL